MGEWKEGYPDKPGIYTCLVDGEECKLKHFICSMSGRHEWVDEYGNYVYSVVLWRG